jgi:hypothetical protein
MADVVKGIFTWATNREDYFHYWVGSTLYTDWNTAVLRNILTTIFIVLGHLILWLGSHYLKKHNQRRLLRGIRVPVSHLTSWLSLSDAASYFLHTFRLPGGSFGWLMLITGVFSLAHQYFVNSFIQQSDIQYTCNFDSGIVDVLPYNNPDGFTPSSTLSAATTIFNAQVSSYYNNGTNGIWRLIPYYAWYFSPTQNDLLGQWNCNPTGSITITSADWSSQQALQSFLINNNLLNTNTGNFAGSEVAGGAANGFLSWYTNYPDTSGAWDTVSASMVFGLSGATSTVSEWTCTLQTFNWDPPTVNSMNALTEWNAKTYGLLQDIAISEYEAGLELILNAMFMAAAGGNVDTAKASEIPANVDITYGCVVPGTQIMVGIWVILGVYLLTLIPLLFVSFITLFPFRKAYKRNDLAGEPPTSVYSWQTVLVREMTGNFDIKTRALRKYFAASGMDGKLIVDTGERLNVS